MQGLRGIFSEENLFFPKLDYFPVTFFLNSLDSQYDGSVYLRGSVLSQLPSKFAIKKTDSEINA